MLTSLRAQIVDDETLGRRLLVRLLGEHAEVEIAAECATGVDAVDAIHRHKPDVVFLDIQMPELDGFGVIEAIGAKAMPPVVFVTAHDEHAIRALRAHALDYLLKPVDPEQLSHALARLRERSAVSATRGQLDLLVRDTAGAHAHRLIVSQGDRKLVVRTAHIDWLEAADDLVRIHCAREVYTVRETLTHLMARLDPLKFARIHRSTGVNLDRIKEIQPWFRGEQLVVLVDDTKLAVGTSYRRAFFERLRGGHGAGE